jgi:hypothetical protein
MVEIPASTRTAIDRHFRAGLRQKSDEAAQDPEAFRLSIARRRYREGFTDRAGFENELEALRVPENQLQLEVIAGDLEAAYDYSMDLLTVYRTAFRSGQISIERFAELVRDIVLVPDRVRAYVARELARFKPEDGPTVSPVPTAEYETDAGKVKVDTIRRLRRKNRIDRNQELADLQLLGMPADVANAIADNDDARLAEKGEEE